MPTLDVIYEPKGSVHKRRPQSGGRWFVQSEQFFGQEKKRTSALFGAKNFGSFEIYVVDKRGRGVNFSRFCADVFYGRPLIGIGGVTSARTQRTYLRSSNQHVSTD